MATRPYDQRVVNPLERPTSTDFNLAQSQMGQAFNRQLMRQMSEGSYADIGAYQDESYGFIDTGFSQLNVTSSRAVALLPGLMIGKGTYSAAVGGISGVSTLQDDYIGYLSSGKVVPVLDPPPAGQCRRDVIAVRPMASLAEYSNTDIFDITAQSFVTTASKPKELRYDMQDATVEVMTAGGGASASSPMVYIPGTPVAYSSADSLLSAPLPTIPTDYQAVCAINVIAGEALIARNRIVDLRLVKSPTTGRYQQLRGKATLGGEAAGFTYLNGYSFGETPVKSPLPWFVYGMSPTFASNYYWLVVVGNAVASGGLVPGTISINRVFPFNQVMTGGAGGLGVQSVMQTFAGPYAYQGTVDSSFLAGIVANRVYAPSIWLDYLAIGQPYIYVPFSFGFATDTINPSWPLVRNDVPLFGYDSAGSQLNDGIFDINFMWKVS